MQSSLPVRCQGESLRRTAPTACAIRISVEWRSTHCSEEPNNLGRPSARQAARAPPDGGIVNANIDSCTSGENTNGVMPILVAPRRA